MRHLSRIRGLAEVATGVLILIGLWQLAHVVVGNPIVLPSPLATAEEAVKLIENGRLQEDVWASVTRVLQGWALAVVVAVVLGGVMGRVHFLRQVFFPVIELIRPVPPIAVVPIGILWFGIGESSKLFIVFYGAFFPTVIGTYDAFRSIDPVYEAAGRTLGSKGFDLFRRVTLMAALPSVLSAMRVGLGLAFVSIVAAELIAASSGLGALISQAYVNFQIRQVFVGVVAIGVVGSLLAVAFRALEASLLKWR